MYQLEIVEKMNTKSDSKRRAIKFVIAFRALKDSCAGQMAGINKENPGNAPEYEEERFSLRPMHLIDENDAHDENCKSNKTIGESPISVRVCHGISLMVSGRLRRTPCKRTQSATGELSEVLFL